VDISHDALPAIVFGPVANPLIDCLATDSCWRSAFRLTRALAQTTSATCADRAPTRSCGSQGKALNLIKSWRYSNRRPGTGFFGNEI
jgi:hypothetical protein